MEKLQNSVHRQQNVNKSNTSQYDRLNLDVIPDSRVENKLSDRFHDKSKI